MSTSVSVEFYKALYVETMNSDYTVLTKFTYLSDLQLFSDVTIHFDVRKDAEMEGRPQMALLKTFFQNNSKMALEDVVCKIFY